jgi:hypothetical protein
MRALFRPFDVVSREQIILQIYALVDPLDSWTDNSATLFDPVLEISVVDPEVIGIEWLVDGVLVQGATGPTFNPADHGFGLGEYTMTARAFDSTGWVLIDPEMLEQSVSWSVVMTPEPSSAMMLVAGLLALRRRGPTRGPRQA